MTPLLTAISGLPVIVTSIQCHICEACTWCTSDQIPQLWGFKTWSLSYLSESSLLIIFKLQGLNTIDVTSLISYYLNSDIPPKSRFVCPVDNIPYIIFVFVDLQQHTSAQELLLLYTQKSLLLGLTGISRIKPRSPMCPTCCTIAPTPRMVSLS